MAKPLKNGDRFKIRDGHTTNHDDQWIDVSGMSGTVVDAEGYETTGRGEHAVGVKLDDEHGGGHVFVPEGRLSSRGRSVSFGTLGAAARKNLDRVLGRR